MFTITDKAIDQAYSDLKSTCGGVRNDYFGLLYLECEYRVPREKAVNQVAFGGNDYGIDGFHFDEQRRNLYLFQFKYSRSAAQFKPSIQRLIASGMERVFSSPNVDDNKNSLLIQLHSCMLENRAMIDQVCIRFVFQGDPDEAERSQVLDKLREDLENKKYLIDQFFQGRQVGLLVEFRSVSGKVGSITHQQITPVYTLTLTDMLCRTGPSGQRMHVAFARLVDLEQMHKDLGNRFFERNIRFGLGDSGAVNRALSRALKEIVLDGQESPAVFAFNHNGITLFAEKLEQVDGAYRISAPRLLNGAQTMTTFRKFIEKNTDNMRFQERREVLADLHVLCRIITQADQSFITSVTVNNNRQNPVEPWNLRANDLIQLEIQDWLRSSLGIYYERQEGAFQSLNEEELEDISESSKAIQLVKLAQTFLVTDGNIAAVSNMRKVFEDDNAYNRVFHVNRLKADPRDVVLSYKIHFRLRRLLQEIEDKGEKKYWFVNRARTLLWALLCQAVLNDPDLKANREQYGSNMTLRHEFTDYLRMLASTRCRPMLAALLKDPSYAAKVDEKNLSFLRSNDAYKRCMNHAYEKWGWVERRLR